LKNFFNTKPTTTGRMILFKLSGRISYIQCYHIAIWFYNFYYNLHSIYFSIHLFNIFIFIFIFNWTN